LFRDQFQGNWRHFRFYRQFSLLTLIASFSDHIRPHTHIILLKSSLWNYLLLHGQLFQLKSRGISRVLQFFHHFPMFIPYFPHISDVIRPHTNIILFKSSLWNHLPLHGQLIPLKSRGISRVLQFFHHFPISPTTFIPPISNLLRQIRHIISFKSPLWTHLIIHGLVNLLTVCNILFQLQFFRHSKTFDNLQPLQWSTIEEFDSSQPAKPPWPPFTSLQSPLQYKLTELLLAARNYLHSTCYLFGAHPSLFVHDGG